MQILDAQKLHGPAGFVLEEIDGPFSRNRREKRLEIRVGIEACVLIEESRDFRHSGVMVGSLRRWGKPPIWWASIHPAAF